MTRALVPTPTAPWRTRERIPLSLLHLSWKASSQSKDHVGNLGFPPSLCVSYLERWETKVYLTGRQPRCISQAGNQGVPHRQASGRNYCSHVRGKYHVSPWHTTSNPDFFFPLDHTENTGLWCSNLDPRHSLLRSQSVHLRSQTALSKRSQRHVTAASSEQRGRKTGRSITIQIN